MPQDNAALPYVLAKKCRLSYEQFMETKEAVYALNFMQGEKVRQLLGSHPVLHLSRHLGVAGCYGECPGRMVEDIVDYPSIGICDHRKESGCTTTLVQTFIYQSKKPTEKKILGGYDRATSLRPCTSMQCAVLHGNLCLLEAF